MLRERYYKEIYQHASLLLGLLKDPLLGPSLPTPGLLSCCRDQWTDCCRNALEDRPTSIVSYPRMADKSNVYYIEGRTRPRTQDAILSFGSRTKKNNHNTIKKPSEEGTLQHRRAYPRSLSWPLAQKGLSMVVLTAGGEQSSQLLTLQAIWESWLLISFEK